MARGSLHFLRVQLQQNTTGFGFQLGLHHNACLFCLHLSSDFSTSLLFYLCVLKCSEVQYSTCAMILFELQEGECWDGIHPDSNKRSDLVTLILIKSY